MKKTNLANLVCEILEHLPNDDCLLWKYCLNKQGYGIVRVPPSAKLAHRIAYQLFRGPIPEGFLVCHHCDIRACFNPWHLFAGTYSDNMRDSINKGRDFRTSQTKLTPAAVRQIRESKLSQCKLAKTFGVSQYAIHKVITRKTWRHVI
mgnify:CR=1 FL=1